MANISKDFKRGTRKEELQLRIIYPKCDLPTEEKNQQGVPLPALHVTYPPSFMPPFILRVQCSSSFHAWELFSGIHLRCYTPDKDYPVLTRWIYHYFWCFRLCFFRLSHDIYVSYMTVNCFCVWPPSSSIMVIIGTQ